MKPIAGLVSIALSLSLSCGVHADAMGDLLADKKPPASRTEDKVISASHSQQQDKLIQKRLHKIYSELEALKAVRISVSNGVITLSGQVDTKASEQKALEFAEKMEDVVEVENKLVVSHALLRRLQQTVTKIVNSGKQAIAGLPLLLLAVFLFWLFWITGKWVSSRRSLYRHITVNAFIADLLSKITHLGFILMGLVTALSLLDATAFLGTILGAAGIFGLAIGFAVRDTVENFIASLLLSIRNPFGVNDVVCINEHQGHVMRLTSRATILLSFDGNHIRIPNATVYKSIIINFSRQSDKRFQFDVGVGMDHDLSQAQRLATEALMQIPGILRQPAIQAVVHELGDSSVLLRIYGWLNQKEHDFLKVRSEAIKAVKKAFDGAGIELPNPTYDLNVSHEQAGSGEAGKSRGKITPTKPLHAGPAEALSDTKADRSVEQQIEKENMQRGNENLLHPDAGSEL